MASNNNNTCYYCKKTSKECNIYTCKRCKKNVGLYCCTCIAWISHYNCICKYCVNDNDSHLDCQTCGNNLSSEIKNSDESYTSIEEPGNGIWIGKTYHRHIKCMKCRK